MRNNNPYENEDLISGFLFLRPAVIPVICFGLSFFVLGKDRYIFSAVAFTLFLFTFWGSDEKKLVSFDKRIKLQFIVFYLIYGITAYFLSSVIGGAAIIFVIAFAILWAYRVYQKYLSVHPDSRSN